MARLRLPRSEVDVAGRAISGGPVFQRIILAFLGTASLLLGVSGLTQRAYVFGGVICLFGAAFAVRGARIGVKADSRGITHRGVEWSRSVPWCRVLGVEAGDPGSSSPLPVSAPILVLDDGGRLPLRGLARSVTTEHGRAAIRATTSALDELLREHRLSCPSCAERP